MIAAIIRWSVQNRLLVLLSSVLLSFAGIWSLRTTPIDALPDLSDVQVIIRTNYPGQAPEIVENQITYPLASTMLSVPGAKTVRGFSFFGDSYLYVIFADGTDLYWARSRVLEYLNQVQSRLPASVKPELGPDATGVGWIYQYALIDRTGQHDLAQLRSLQDWFLKFELASLQDVAEVASIGGMVKQFQILLDPVKMATYGISHQEIEMAVQAANQETGGGVLTLAETEFMVRTSGYLHTTEDFKAIPLKSIQGVAITLGDLAHIQHGPEIRRGIAELDGEGEVVGGVIILRSGKNARATIKAVKDKLTSLRKSLPPGVELITTYDRSQLIDRAVNNLNIKLLEEMLMVALVCCIFLWHWRSAFVAVIALPLGILVSFLIMRIQGINANIMSLGGIAIAIGAMVDAAIVMIENAHKHLEYWQESHPRETISDQARWQVLTQAAVQVGPSLFFSLLIIAISFIPVFMLEAQEGRLFGPLAYTKTYAMAAAAGISITLIPVLMGYWIKGKIPPEKHNPLNNFFIGIYEPALNWVLINPKKTFVVAFCVFLTSAWPIYKIGGEFLPPLDEGDLLYMPSALPGLSAQKASELLQQTNLMIKSVPEVARVFGKAGRANSATDPAPLEMFETSIQFKPHDQWRKDMTMEKLINELDEKIKVPGLTNFWIPPIRNRIDMLATGIKSPIGIKVAGNDLTEIDAVAKQVEQIAKQVEGVSSALAERQIGGHYLDIDIDRTAAARYGLNIAEIQSIITRLVGGDNISEVIDGRARYPINLRYPRSWRNDPEQLKNLPIISSNGTQLTLSSIAEVKITHGPPMLRSENARPTTWVYINVTHRDLSATVADLRKKITNNISLNRGITIAYSGQYEFIERANERLTLLIPFTLLLIFILLFLAFNRIDEALVIMLTLPFALTGGIWFIYLLGYNFSIATGVGFIALAGLAAEFGVLMLIYLKNAWQYRLVEGKNSKTDLLSAIHEGALLRIRPKAMTVAVIIAGLLPIVFGSGTGSEIMSRIAAPMLGGMITAPVLSLLILPALYKFMHESK
jgi:copper/silver efflux system protein